jgi:hypothetical protein
VFVCSTDNSCAVVAALVFLSFAAYQRFGQAPKLGPGALVWPAGRLTDSQIQRLADVSRAVRRLSGGCKSSPMIITMLDIVRRAGLIFMFV